MNLPFSTPDLEDGFAASTPLKNRPPFAGPSSFSWNQEPIGPPPKGKGKASATQLRDPDDELSDDENITPQKYGNPQVTPLSGYGMHSTQNKGEDVFSRNNQQIPQQNVPQQNIPQQPIYPQPAYHASPKIIKEPGLFYDGENFSKFLRRFERAAQAFQASDYEKALQIGRFMKTEELRDQIEAMDGYIAYDWPKLRKEMIDTWGGLDNTILYTTNDLVKVTEEVAAKGGIKTSRELTAYVTKYTSIMKYLITNGHIHKEEDTSILFMKAFSKEIQQNIKRHLVSYDLLPKGPDGSNLPPKWAHLVKVAEMEVRIVEPGYLDVTNTNFSEANQLMQKRLDAQKGDSQRRNQMIAETPNDKTVVDKNIADMAKEIASLKQQLKSVLPVAYNQPSNLERTEFSRGNARPSTPLYESQICFYCRREGHVTHRCPELQKDESEGLVQRSGKDWYLPNGQHIPWVPSRPIRSVVATASADPAIQEASKRLVEQRKAGQVPTGMDSAMKTSMQIIDWDPPELGADNFPKNHAVTRSDAQKGRRTVRIQEPEDDSMNIDQEEDIANLDQEATITPTKKFWGKEKAKSKSNSVSPEVALLQDLDHLKIPTTFAQLTTLSPLYTEQIIARLQQRLPGKSSATYMTSEEHKVAAAMTTQADKNEPTDPCYYSCALGYVTAEIGGAKINCMIDSGSMVNVIPYSVAEDLDLEIVQVDIPMKGVGGARCDLNGVAENCPVGIGRFSGPAHLNQREEGFCAFS
ncbi:uncharacterized protein PGTG_12774 [Puccinia graminis f. sp. tritici CRL 75-36-700-3]|uniref:CCHC-type domain-containing protein n=1 Tax=Puccinia graminis f. sp. tritici (strain CRL 75-36-700-3 / race SCCL) TaxID=418459 RepID=E3KRV8_PUCGT|nr:uncharacterized protein PGTG_12774 [Puccinia graminis f. sp. tritici CRL 75-36-700-3]EFP87033.1 hypothetical protein PGTG_12774 [Puccinia graminis f. sp. tritici CRL 75-36-700-3]